MTLSINTNVGAMVALQNLNKTNDLLDRTNLNITTGLKVNGPKDDASTYAIAQNLRGDIAGISAVQIALAGGESIIDVAIEASKAISDLLIEMKAKVVAGLQDGLDSASRTALNNDFGNLRATITEIVGSASFNGTNMIDGSLTSLSVLSTAEGNTISVAAETMTVAALAIDSSSLATRALASAALTAVDAALESVNASLASLGSIGKRIEIQSSFTTKLRDILRAGVGNLVDTDLAEESAKLQALQIQQQLGVQALSIANSGPQTILALFG